MDNIQYQKHRYRNYNKKSKINARGEKFCNGNERMSLVGLLMTE